MMKRSRNALVVLPMVLSSMLLGACNKSDPDAAAQVDTADPPDQTATQAPPPPENENPGPPPNATDQWAGGSWQFNQGKFVWEKGHWETRHEGQYQQARWVQVSGRWEHHPGRWVVARPGEVRPMEQRPVEVRPPEPRPGEPRPVERRPDERRP
jgi:hypothetical protein